MSQRHQPPFHLCLSCCSCFSRQVSQDACHTHPVSGGSLPLPWLRLCEASCLQRLHYPSFQGYGQCVSEGLPWLFLQAAQLHSLPQELIKNSKRVGWKELQRLKPEEEPDAT